MLGLALLCSGLGALGTMWISGWLMSKYSSRKITILAGILVPDFLNRTWTSAEFLVVSGVLVSAGGLHRGDGHRHEQPGCCL